MNNAMVARPAPATTVEPRPWWETTCGCGNPIPAERLASPDPYVRATCTVRPCEVTLREVNAEHARIVAERERKAEERARRESGNYGFTGLAGREG